MKWRTSIAMAAICTCTLGALAAGPTAWTETFDTDLGRLDETLLLGDSLFSWDATNQRMQAEFRRNEASDRRAALLGRSFGSDDVFGFSVVVTPLDRDPGSNLSIEGKIGFFDSGENNLDANSIGIVIRDDFQRFRLFGPGIDSSIRPVAWERHQPYFLEFLYDGTAGEVIWSVFEGNSAQGLHLGTYIETAPPISVDSLGVGGVGGSLIQNNSYDGYLRAGIDNFSFIVPAPAAPALLVMATSGLMFNRRRAQR